jgi:NodT family efflux transporter outer membrane factor (OMF) lipoprotein
VRWALAGVLIALASGCRVGPDYHIPGNSTANAPDANETFLNGNNPAFTGAPLPERWWRLYDDPRLDSYVSEALAANTDLRAAQANLERANAAIREAQSAQTIGTAVQAGIVNTRQGGIDTLSFPDWSYSLGFGVSYPLDLAGGIRRTVEAARADAQAGEATRDQVRVTVAAAVARNYVAVCSANRSLTAAQGVVDIESQTLEEIRRLFRGGRNTAFDVTRAETAVSQSAAAIPPIIAQRQAALYALTALMGRPTADYPQELEDCPAPPSLRQPLPVGDGVALIRRRSDVRSAERSLAAATASIGVETAALYPQVSLGGQVGYAGPFSTIGSASSFGGNVGPLLSWTFPNRSLAHARIAEAGAAARAAQAQFDGTVLNALQQTEAALNTYVHELDHNQALGQARDSAAKSTSQARALLRFGRTSVLDVLNVEASLATAETAVASSDAAIADDQVNIFLALGGGWDQPDRSQ